MNDEQFTIHFEKIKQDIFRLGRLEEEIEEQKKAMSTSDYELADIFELSEPIHCEHLLKNRACGRPIKHVYLVRELNTEKLFNVGSTCYVKMQTHREDLSPNEQRNAIRTYKSFQRTKEDFSNQRALLLAQMKEFIEQPIQYLFDLADEYQFEIDKQALLETMKSENIETISQLTRKIDDLWVEIHHLQSERAKTLIVQRVVASKPIEKVDSLEIEHLQEKIPKVNEKGMKIKPTSKYISRRRPEELRGERKRKYYEYKAKGFDVLAEQLLYFIGL